MTSKTRMLDLVKAFDWQAVAQALAETPALLTVRDERGRTWLHICCARQPKDAAETEASVRTADVLIAAGIDISDVAFTEGDWRATPLWCAIGRGHNLVLAGRLLELGCDPEHCLWAATFAHDIKAIRLLVNHGATVDALHEDGTPFMGAVKISHFEEAEVFLELGANVDVQDSAGLTALHLLLKKGSGADHVGMLIRHGARGDIPDKDGRTAIEIMRRKKDPVFRRMAEALAAR